MPRTLSAGTVAAIQAVNTSVVFHGLITITHPTLTEPIRVCDNNEAVTSRGHIYYPIAFTSDLPDDTADALPTARITLDNVAQELIDAIRGLTTPPKFTLEVVTSDNPNYVELLVADLLMRSVTWNDTQITAELSSDDILNQKWPEGTFNPAEYAGIFN